MPHGTRVTFASSSKTLVRFRSEKRRIFLKPWFRVRIKLF